MFTIFLTVSGTVGSDAVGEVAEGKEERATETEAVLYGAREIEGEQVGIGLEIILFDYLFAPHVGAISASISELIWALASAIVSTFNGFIQAPSGAILSTFNDVIGIVTAEHVSAYLTTVEGGFGRGFENEFAAGFAAFLSTNNAVNIFNKTC